MTTNAIFGSRRVLIATRNPGDFVAETLPNAEPFGTIEVGKRADLLLLDSDPLTDLSNLERTVGVMARGRWYSRDSLDGRLEAIAAGYASITPPRPPAQTTDTGGGAFDIYWLLLLFLVYVSRIDSGLLPKSTTGLLVLRINRCFNRLFMSCAIENTAKHQ